MSRQKVVSWAGWKSTFLEHSTYSQWYKKKKSVLVTTLELSGLQCVSHKPNLDLDPALDN